MSLIDFPSTPFARSMAWRLVMPTQVNVSEWTGARQAMASGRGWWECQFELPPIVGEREFRPWGVFVAKARGSTNTFEVPVDSAVQVRGLQGYTARVNGGSQTGRSLITDGWPVSRTVLYAGQFVTVGDQLLRLTSDIAANGSGQATIAFEGALRASPADNAVIEFVRPYCLMYLAEEPTVSIEPGRVHSLSLKLREAF